MARCLTSYCRSESASFVTFTLTAYIVDVYRGKFTAGTRPLTVLGHVPVLSPPDRRSDPSTDRALVPQLEHPRRKKSLLPTAAVAVFTIGLVKKLVFADTIAGLVDAAYAHAGVPSAPEALMAMYAFSVQIYCDFAGYTDMAIGLAMLLGVRLPNNFRQPYCADSIVQFWRRWHMTLSFWLRDYLYIPLGGNSHGRLHENSQYHDYRWLLAACGTARAGISVVWGLPHGAGVSAVHAARKIARWTWLDRVARWLGVLLTFHFVTLAWVFFRAPNLRPRRRYQVTRRSGGEIWAGAT